MLISTLPLDRAHCSFVYEGFLFENRSKSGRRHVQFARRRNALNQAGVQVHTLLVECMATKAGWPAALGWEVLRGRTLPRPTLRRASYELKDQVEETPPKVPDPLAYERDLATRSIQPSCPH